LHEQYDKSNTVRGGINMIGAIGVIILLIIGFGYSQMRKTQHDRNLRQKAHELEENLKHKS